MGNKKSRFNEKQYIGQAIGGFMDSDKWRVNLALQTRRGRIRRAIVVVSSNPDASGEEFNKIQEYEVLPGRDPEDPRDGSDDAPYEFGDEDSLTGDDDERLDDLDDWHWQYWAYQPAVFPEYGFYPVREREDEDAGETVIDGFEISDYTAGTHNVYSGRTSRGENNDNKWVSILPLSQVAKVPEARARQYGEALRSVIETEWQPDGLAGLKEDEDGIYEITINLSFSVLAAGHPLVGVNHFRALKYLEVEVTDVSMPQYPEGETAIAEWESIRFTTNDFRTDYEEPEAPPGVNLLVAASAVVFPRNSHDPRRDEET